MSEQQTQTTESKPDSKSFVAQTQNQRRATYGLNVIIACAAATAIVVLLNWVLNTQSTRLGPAAQSYLRFDFTATREYSLSDQTLKILTDLEDSSSENNDVEIITYFDDGLTLAEQTQRQRVRDLIDEYDRRSNRVAVQHIRRQVDARREAALRDRIMEPFATQLEPMAEAIEAGRQAMQELGNTFTQLAQPLRNAAENEALRDPRVTREIRSVAAAFQGLQQQLDRRDSEVQQYLDQPLPLYTAAKTVLVDTLVNVEFQSIIDRFQQIGRDDTQPGDVRNTLLTTAQRLETVKNSLDESIEALELLDEVVGAGGSDEYDQITSMLLSSQAVLVFKGDKLRVVPISEMYATFGTSGDDMTDVSEPDTRFLGEERLTGALVSLSMDQPPLIVFVNAGQFNAIGPRGMFNQVTQRLLTASFEVKQWSPEPQGMTPGMQSFGQTPPIEPAPEGKPGQPVVWIVPPMPTAQINDPASMAQAANVKQAVGQLLEQRLAQGESALISLGLDLTMRTADPSEVRSVMTDWGIKALTDRVLVREMPLPDGDTASVIQMIIEDWSETLAANRDEATGDGFIIPQAMRGLSTVITPAIPLEYEAAENVEHQTLIAVADDRLWAEDNIESLQNRAAEFRPEAAKDRFILGIAAERELETDNESISNPRLIVVGNNIWASDVVTTNHSPDLNPQMQGTAQIFGAAYPGNSELFVNSVYWLAGLDELIAASPRSQDMRRIEPIEPGLLNTYRIILAVALPIGIGIAGVAMWLTRRRA